MGKEPYKDIDIEHIGLRPGEKVYEELLSEEIDSRTQYENITIAKATMLNWEEVEKALNDLLGAAHLGDAKICLRRLNGLVSNGNLWGDKELVAPVSQVSSQIHNEAETTLNRIDQ